MLRLNARRQDPLKINGIDVEDTDSFVYLGAIVNNSGDAEQDIRSRLGKAIEVFFIDFQRCGKQVNSAEKLR